MMKLLDLKPTHKAVTAYYAELEQLAQMKAHKEGAVAPAFANLLRHCAAQFDHALVEQYTFAKGAKNLFFDGVILDKFNLKYGVWEAKDDADDLPAEVKKKFAAGYPKENILFQAPQRAILWQNGVFVNEWDMTQPLALIAALKAFFEYTPPVYEEWQQAVEQFSGEVKNIGEGLLKLIETERTSKNAEFLAAFDRFVTICRDNINPNIAIAAVEEMLIQHLLTERIFSKILDQADFTKLNIIAAEIEKVATALVKPHGGRALYFKELDRFYHAIEATAATLKDFSEKQAFLNLVYERFFQGFAVKVADTHGIVYTPQPVVEFMVNSVDELLKTEFNLPDGLSAPDVHILDPFVGTGNFIVCVMRKLKKTALPRKYGVETPHPRPLSEGEGRQDAPPLRGGVGVESCGELHCNEVMLLPYYIASLNIEHEYYALTGDYQPFEGICFVDTFQLAEPEQAQFVFMTPENTQRVKAQKAAPIFVILGNPPYNAGQQNENDNNKNRKYDVLDKEVRDTYAKDSQATNKNALADVYVKAIRYASNRITEHGEGIVAFITNNGFLDGVAFDGMRKALAQDFDAMYFLDLGGNVRKNPKLSGTTHNVFGIQVGVSINLLVKKNTSQVSKTCEVWYARLDEFWRKEQKYRFLEEAKQYKQIAWQRLTPDAKHNWLTEGMQDEFDTFLPMGTKAGKAVKKGDSEAIFKTYSRGAETCRDDWAYNFNRSAVADNMKRMIETYNYEIYRWQTRTNKQANLDDFVTNDSTKIKWSSRLKECLTRGQKAEFAEEKIRRSLYRPFTEECLFFDGIMTHRQGQFPRIFPTPDTEADNRVICVSAVGNTKTFHCLMSNIFPDLHLTGDSQCFPFYVYDEDPSTGSGQATFTRRENITDWALAQFRARYATPPQPLPEGEGRSPSPSERGQGVRSLTKWDIFYYVYALLHHPHYRAKYAANLKRDLPRIPFVGQTSQVSKTCEVFWRFADAGRQLADLHVKYDQQPRYPLQFLETEGAALDWHVKKMKLSKDQTQIIYNDFLTLAGIPPEAFEYKLGNKSALHWLLDQYQVSTDPRSGIVNDPNRADEPDYIVTLIQRVITVSVETVKIVAALPNIE